MPLYPATVEGWENHTWFDPKPRVMLSETTRDIDRNHTWFYTKSGVVFFMTTPDSFLDKIYNVISPAETLHFLSPEQFFYPVCN